MRKIGLRIVDYTLLLVALGLLFQAVRAFLSDESFFATAGWVGLAFVFGAVRGFFRLFTGPN